MKINQPLQQIAKIIQNYQGKWSKNIGASSEYKFVKIVAQNIESFKNDSLDLSKFPTLETLFKNYPFFKRDIAAKITFALNNQPIVPVENTRKYLGFQKGQEVYIGHVNTDR